MATCKHPGCTNQAKTKGLCSACYQKDRRGTLGKEPKQARANPFETKATILIQLPASLKIAIMEAAEKEGIAVAVWVRKALEQKLKG